MLIKFCGDDHKSYYCPSATDDVNKTECCPDMLGCCYPWQYSHNAIFTDDMNWYDHFANLLVVGFALLFVIVVTCFCIQSCKDADEVDDYDEGDHILIRHHEAEINTVAIPTDENNRTSLSIISAYEGHPVMPASPPGYDDPSALPPKYEQTSFTPSYNPYERGSGYSTNSPLLSSEQGQWYTSGDFQQPSAPPMTYSQQGDRAPPAYQPR
ncbi:uncharacterized protein [Ptychodera flava]|uniref:uncharacterized protein n=1 Tax=Ptychodera flava TaxID=63121 RepID=UPI00396A6AEB